MGIPRFILGRYVTDRGYTTNEQHRMRVEVDGFLRSDVTFTNMNMNLGWEVVWM
jgi:hypothetical protein